MVEKPMQKGIKITPNDESYAGPIADLFLATGDGRRAGFR